jgi:hypothetical protein
LGILLKALCPLGGKVVQVMRKLSKIQVFYRLILKRVHIEKVEADGLL